MAYKDVLTKAITQSGLSLREICRRCEAIGVSISPSYLSQLQSGKITSPSEEVSKAVAQACLLSDATELVFEGYIEKAPELVKYYLTVTSETNKQLLEIAMKHFEPKIDPEYIKSLDTFLHLGSSISYLKKLQKGTDTKPLIDLYNLIRDKMFESGNIDEVEQIFMNDDSMESVIPKNSKLKIISYKDNEPQDKDIIAFSYRDDKKIYVRRYYKHNDIISLIPENKTSDIIHIKKLKEISMFGKVISYTASINY